MKLNEINRQADLMFPLLTELRRHLHINPELGQQEFMTQKFIMEFLQNEGIPCEKIADTGVIAWVKGNAPGRVVAARADIDALPILEDDGAAYCSVNKGVMHACGHDAHTAINMGLAKFFNDNKESFHGTVKFFYQPAEETVGGARRMIEAGCMENPKVDYVIGLHVMPYIYYNQVEVKHGPLNASTNTVRLTVRGKSGHGAYPDICVDAIMIAAQIIVSLQSVVSRNISPLDCAVLTFGKINGGKAGNVIADEVELVGTLRSSGPHVEKIMLEKVRTIATGIAAAMGGECIMKLGGDGYLPLVNDDEIIDLITENAVEYLGAENVNFKPVMSMGGEDFSFFNANTRGAFYSLGCRVQGREPYGLHTKQFDIDERCLKTGLVLQAMNIYKLLAYGKL